MEERIRKFRLD